MCFYHVFLLMIGVLSTLLCNTVALSLEQALSEDHFPPVSDKCLASAASADAGNYSVSFDFIPSNVTSEWDEGNAVFEKYTFLAEMSHQDPNVNKTWKLRVGSGGNVYSFVGVYGEAMPPQKHELGPFVDEVWQTVGVIEAHNDVAGGNPYYIHQAGTYQKDDGLLKYPFFSPNIAKHCEGRGCTFVSWGQHAHVPTKFISNLLNYVRYYDCGNGVVETTYLIHNFADPSDTTFNQEFNWLNIPWGGVRQSVFSDALITDSGDSTSHLQSPLPAFGTAAERIADHDRTLGYNIYTESLQHEMPEFELCGSASGGAEVSCSSNGAVRAHFTLDRNNPCSYSGGHSDTLGKYTAFCWIEQNATISSGCTSGALCFFSITNPRNNYTFTAGGIHHWAWDGVRIFLYPNVDVGEINANCMQGDSFIFSHESPPYKRVDDNLALAFVYGDDRDLHQDTSTGDRVWVGRSSWIRGGFSGSIENRDYIVYSVIAKPKLTPSRTYHKKHHIITGRLADMDAEAAQWVAHTSQGMFFQGDYPGHEVVLFSSGNVSYGVDLSQNVNLTGLSAQVRCSGYTTPQTGTFPLFYVRCQDMSYTGRDPYYFAPDGDIRRPYVCNGQDEEHATWKLLGFFTPGSCAFLESAHYDSGFDGTTSAPTHIPTAAPTAVPTAIPTAPTSIPSSSAPTLQPTLERTAPTVEPTSIAPTVMPSAVPSVEPTSSQPTLAPTQGTAVGTPTAAPTAVNSSFIGFTAECNRPAAADFYSSLADVVFCSEFPATDVLSQVVLTYNMEFHSAAATVQVIVSGANNSGYRFGDVSLVSADVWGQTADLTFVPWNFSTVDTSFGGDYHTALLSNATAPLAPMAAVGGQGVFDVCIFARDDIPGGLMGRVTFPGTDYFCEAPSAPPSVQPTPDPTVTPSAVPSSTIPSAAPSVQLTADPSAAPTFYPTFIPTDAFSVQPSAVPSTMPSLVPTTAPSPVPGSPTQGPTASYPTAAPTVTPTALPTTETPTFAPTGVPSLAPSVAPTALPTTETPTFAATGVPSVAPSVAPTVVAPTETPTFAKTGVPSVAPSVAPPTGVPSFAPTALPTTATPTFAATGVAPTETPTFALTGVPSVAPSVAPTALPTTETPTFAPTGVPSLAPSVAPTALPTTETPTFAPTGVPSLAPSVAPAVVAPTETPTFAATGVPSGAPSMAPTALPTTETPTFAATGVPSLAPSVAPTAVPTTETPTAVPTSGPSALGSVSRSSSPSVLPGAPTSEPSAAASPVPPTISPSQQSTTAHPSATVSEAPSVVPSGAPSEAPVDAPTSRPSQAPVVTPYLFALTPFMKETCFSQCDGHGYLVTSDTKVAEQNGFCSLYAASGCENSSVAGYACMPACIPDPSCGTVFCNSFALMSHVCTKSPSDSTLVGSLRTQCLAAYLTAQDVAGRSSSQVAFGLKFVIPNMDGALLSSDASAIEAIASTVAQVLPGVVSVSNVTVVSVTATRRRLATGSQVSLAVIGIPSGTSSLSGGVSDNEARRNADSFVSDFAAAVDSKVFGTTLTSTVRSLGATSIPVESIDGMDASSVQLDLSVDIGFAVTAAPTATPTAAPSFVSADSTDASSPEIIIVGMIVVALVAVGGGFVYYRFFSVSGSTKGSRLSSKVMDLHSIPQHVGHNEQLDHTRKDVEKGYIVTTVDQPAAAVAHV